MLLKNTKKIKLNMSALAKKILDSNVPINITLTEIWFDRTGQGAYICKQILEEAVHEEIKKAGDHYIITQTEMSELCRDIILYVTKEAERRLTRIVRLGFTREQMSKVVEGEQEYEIEDEKEFEMQIGGQT